MKRFLPTFILFLSVLLVSCNSNEIEEVVESTISLSKEGTIEVPNTAFEDRVTVTTNEKEWKCYSSTTWLELSQQENTLVISVTPNTGTEQRTAVISVFAGNAKKEFSVKQAAGAIKIDFAKDKITVDNWGGSFIIDVNTNSNNWTVEQPKDEWIKLTPHCETGELLIEISENTEVEKRNSSVKVLFETTEPFTITVEQGPALFYILPYLDPSATTAKIYEYEAARRSTVVFDKESTKNPTYDTKSKAFSQMQYIFESQSSFTGNYLIEVKSIVETASVLDENFIQFLKDNGFVATDDANIYEKEVSDDNNIPHIITASIVRNDEEGNNGIYYGIVPKQLKSVSTISTIPLGNLEFNKATYESIAAIETSVGGVGITPSEWKYKKYEYPNDKEFGLIFREYECINTIGHFLYGVEYLKDVDRFYYEAKGGNYYMAKEFKSVFKKEGYREGPKLDGGYTLYYKDSYALAIRRARYKGLNDDKPVLEIRFMSNN